MIYDCSSSQSCDSASCSYFHTQHFLQPPIFPKNLTNLTDLTDFTILQTPYRQCAGTFRTSYNRATRTGAPIFFRAPCTGCCIAAFRRGWKSCGGRPGGLRRCKSASRAHACKLREKLGGGLEIWVAGGLESFVAAIWKSGGVRSGGPRGGGQAAGNLSQSVVEEFRGGGLARTRACRNHAFFQRFCQKSS